MNSTDWDHDKGIYLAEIDIGACFTLEKPIALLGKEDVFCRVGELDASKHLRVIQLCVYGSNRGEDTRVFAMRNDTVVWPVEMHARPMSKENDL